MSDTRLCWRCGDPIDDGPVPTCDACIAKRDMRMLLRRGGNFRHGRADRRPGVDDLRARARREAAEELPERPKRRPSWWEQNA